MLAAVTALAAALAAQSSSSSKDILGDHDLSAGTSSTTTGALSGACLYCHAPHSGLNGTTSANSEGLWNHKLSSATYTLYTSTTYQQTGTQPTLGKPSSLCLSCHDGTVALGQTIAYGKVSMSQEIQSSIGTDLRLSHPISLTLPIKDAPLLLASFVSTGVPADSTGCVHLIKGNLECTTCHDPHDQFTDASSPDFLVRTNTNSEICLSCHDLSRTDTSSTSTTTTSDIQWTQSAHAIAQNRISTAASTKIHAALSVTHPTVSSEGCLSCHAVHNAATAEWLLQDGVSTSDSTSARKSSNIANAYYAGSSQTGITSTGGSERTCLRCHAGDNNTIHPQPANILSEFEKEGHPFPTTSARHTAKESALLEHDRHATCVDCHNPHSARRTKTAQDTTGLSDAQKGVRGIQASDGTTVLQSVTYEYENCLRCHGSSTGKAELTRFGYYPSRVASSGDPLDVRAEMSQSAYSSHPVMHERNSSYAQPSLRTAMVQFDGATAAKAMGTTILCSDCHNSDDNRRSGGSGPSGPHGSRYNHILERRYELSQAAAPGQSVENLFPSPDLTANGPYALCQKCHDLQKVVNDTSFAQHARHINDGFSCSVCHSAHGVPVATAGNSGHRLVNFDANVVSGISGATPYYDETSGTCSVYCHGHVHQSKTAQAHRASN
ncbi:MAG: cytochrome c3 family protein [Acidobacteriota bacterium]|nr:cytochrome c3 family protein [Acidobacteriota bacterium]